jgi:hypothetical protein
VVINPFNPFGFGTAEPLRFSLQTRNRELSILWATGNSQNDWLAGGELILTAVPAFVVGLVVVNGSASYAVSEIPTFMVSMPLLIGVWFYLVGTMIDTVVRSMSRR